jgi:hypothetical protein
MGKKQAVIVLLVAVLSCTPPPAPDWHYSPYRRELTEQDTTPVPGPYYGQYWACTCSDGFMMVRTDTVQVRHVWSRSVVPMSGPEKDCSLPPERVRE